MPYLSGLKSQVSRQYISMKPDHFQQYRLLSDDNVKCFITFPQLKELRQKG